MLIGVHTIIYAEDAVKTQAFFRDVLDLRSVDAGDGWLIFTLPPAELGIHPAPKRRQGHELFLMCDDIKKAVASLKRKGVEFTRPVEEAGWGRVTTLRVPGGGELSLYEPRHPMAIEGRGRAKQRRGNTDGSSRKIRNRK